MQAETNTTARPTRVLPRRPQGGYSAGMKYPNRLKEMRERARLSQEDLADALGSGRSTITKYEGGERKIPDARKARIAEILGCEPWELMAAEISPSEEEAELVKIFRGLDPERKQRLAATARDLRRAQDN